MGCGSKTSSSTTTTTTTTTATRKTAAANTVEENQKIVVDEIHYFKIPQEILVFQVKLVINTSMSTKTK